MTYQPIGGVASPLQPPGLGNSTVTPLVGGATFTGAWEEIVNFGSISVNASADVVGQLFADFSSDGITVDRSVTLSNGFDGNFGIHSLIPVNSFFRVRVVNGVGAQATFRLETLYFRGARIAQPTSRLGQNLGQFSDVINSRVGNDFRLDTAQGVIGERFSVDVRGRRPSVSTGSVDDITPLAALVYPFPQAATAVRVAAGGNANDTAAGTGARQVTIEGLDANLDLASETIATAGAGASAATTTLFWRINKAFVTQVGTYGGTAAADVTIESNPGGVILALIQAATSVGQLGLYSIPAGKTAYVTRADVNVASSKSAQVFLVCRSFLDTVAAPMGPELQLFAFDDLQGTAAAVFDAYIPVPEKSDIWFRAQSNTTAGAVDVKMDLILVDD